MPITTPSGGHPTLTRQKLADREHNEPSERNAAMSNDNAGPLDPQDVMAIRMMAGAHFGPNASVTLPSGRKIDAAEMQALTSAYAPAYGQDAELSLDEIRAREDADLATPPVRRMDAMSRTPDEAASLVEHYLANGGTANDRTLAILAEADRGRARRAARVTPVPEVAPATEAAPAAERRGWRRWLGRRA